MPPIQYPAPQPQQPQQDPYAFFMEQQAQQKRSLFSGGKFIWIIIAAVIGLLLIGLVLVLTQGGGQSSASLLSIAQKQDEIIRVSTLGNKNIRNTSLQNFAATTQVSIKSSEQETIAYLGKAGIKADAKTLALGVNTKTDKALAAAQAANTYDVTFTSTMRSELNSYIKSIREASSLSTSRIEKALLQKQYNSALLLVKMLDQQ